MAMAKVWNKNFLPFTQEFEGKDVHIEPNHYVVMDHEKGRMFAAKYFPIKKDAGGRQTPDSYKMIEVEVIGSKEDLEKVNKLRCQACTFVGADKKDLDTHITERHIHLMVDKDERDKRTKTR
jgi:uncharacterized C2H2 Zn-finger protein